MKLDGNGWQSLSIFRGFFWAEKRGRRKALAWAWWLTVGLVRRFAGFG
jgi:hypothetical protein